LLRAGKTGTKTGPPSFGSLCGQLSSLVCLYGHLPFVLLLERRQVVGSFRDRYAEMRSAGHDGAIRRFRGLGKKIKNFPRKTSLELFALVKIDEDTPS
jgi:hypothetical protein